MNISRKLPLAIAALTTAAVVATAFVAFTQARDALQSSEMAALYSAGESRTSEVGRYLDTIRSDLALVASNPETGQAFMSFRFGWQGLGDNPEEQLQTTFIDDNPHVTGEKDKLTDPGTGSDYARAHVNHHPWFRQLQRDRGYYDVFLIDADGNLIYSVFKETDFATNLLDGRWASSGLGEAFRAGMEAEAGDAVFVDFSPYGPSADAPASFIATPVMSGTGGTMGVLAFQMPVDNINAVMQQVAGMGETGETYLVGSDYLMRSNSRFSGESTTLREEVRTRQVDLALDGQSGVTVAEDYRGEPVAAAYSSVDFLGTTWAVLAEKDLAEIAAPANRMAMAMGGTAALTLLVAVGLGAGMARRFTRPITRLTTAMSGLSKRDWTIQVPGLGRSDEIGSIAAAVETFRENGLEMDELRDAQKAAEERAAAERRDAVRVIADQFEARVGGAIEAVSSSAAHMETAARSMSTVADGTQERAGAVAAASEQASANVQAVSTAAEELTASIDEINRQVTAASDIAKEASSKAEGADNRVTSLAAAADRISDVVKLIRDVAEQTNLLALNATIEAARAGEAGKGFAVVASEVKSLATQTQQATEQIASHIKDLQTETGTAVESIRDIRQVVERVTDVSQSIASAIEEQHAATREISGNAQQASDGTLQVSEAIHGVREAASQNGRTSDDILAASRELADTSVRLNEAVSGFLSDIRKDTAQT